MSFKASLTDVTLPEEYFSADAGRPPSVKDQPLDFTYLFDDRVENPDYLTMGFGVQIRGTGKELEQAQPTKMAAVRSRIDECELLTLEELADRLELTRERVRQIQLEALGQLRRILKRRGISRDALL